MDNWVAFDGDWYDFLEAFPHGERVGLLLRIVDSGGAERIRLVGHINPLGGVCDDCSDFHGGERITGYCRVWDAKAEAAK